MPVVRRLFIEKHEFGFLDRGSVDHRMKIELSHLLIGETERVFHDEGRAASICVARFGDRAITPPVSQITELGHVVRVRLRRSFGGALL